MTEAYPLSWPIGWPRTSSPERSRFGDWNNKPSIARATHKLLSELRLLNKGQHSEIIISTNLRLKNDGLPYSVQRDPDDRGAAVYFKRNGEDMVIACDSYEKVGCNLWAMAKTVEAMRGIDRWGCSELLNRAFTGFKALPENASLSNNWWTILEIAEGTVSLEDIKAAYRKKVKEFHPDNLETGDSDKFREVQEAYNKAIHKYPSNF